MKIYKRHTIVDGKLGYVIVDENWNIINRNPTKKELKCIENEPYIRNDKNRSYTNKELLDYLIQFYKRYGRVSVASDFKNNSEYPSFKTYQDHFGSWSNALKLVELDVDSMVKRGILVTLQQKARLAETNVINHFKQYPIDLAGKNQNSPCDGICPNGKTYDVKSSGLHDTYYMFNTFNKQKEDIEIYYFLAFNKDWTILEYVWRVPGEIVENDHFVIGRYRAKFNIKNMKQYDITEKFKDIINT